MIPARTGSILLLVSSLALAACGSSAKKVDPAADLALAKLALLTKADLPGYTGKPHTKSDDLSSTQKKDFATCVGLPTTIFDDTPGAQNADSPDFSKGQASASSSAEIDPKKGDIDTGWKQISAPGVGPCLRKLFEAVIKGDPEFPKSVALDTSIEKFDVGIGSRSVGYAFTFTATGPGGTVVIYLDVIFLPRDRAGLDFEFSNVGTPPVRSFETALVRKVYDRVGSDAK
jgi:hypothetical protein